MSRRKLFYYFILPFGTTLLCMGLYFSGSPALQSIITPDIPFGHPNAKREFGLLENLQNLVLLIVIAFAVQGIRVKRHPLEKAAMLGLTLMAVLVFLEEIDYGLHFWEYIRQVPPDLAKQTRNLHNVGDRTSDLKRIVDLGTIVFFVLFPLLTLRNENRFVRYIRPDTYIVLTVAAAFLTRTIAHFLRDQGLGEGGFIQKNISEFREFVTYYTVMLFVYEFSRRNWTDAPKAEGPSPEES